ncbi:TPA: hypothetical protein PXP51_001545 [Yersinia enterocolitica]|nr:hypothetical protein [Yersinia enterocolitica]HDL7749209.1 hypothetical protein [Yersinia enterocolitica]HEN3478642.1 hypothetical protein [Yersinia enterocolitica]
MMDWIYATTICTMIFCYWIYCRSNALKYQERAVRIIEICFANNVIPEKEKNKMYISYWIMRRWLSLPVMLIVAPFFIIYSIVLNNYTPENLNNKGFDNFFSILMQMYIAKNPLTSIIILSLMGIIFAISLVISTVLNQASKAPNPTMLVSSIITKLITLQLKIRHAH